MNYYEHHIAMATCMTDAESEAHIKDCGLLMLKAHREGDFAAAHHWLQLQNEAIQARSFEQVARMEGCYFATEGEKARIAAQARAADA